MSAGMGERFAKLRHQFTEKIRKLGPNPAEMTRPYRSRELAVKGDTNK